MTCPVSPDDRDAILRYASALLPADDRANPARVAVAALPLLEWAEQAEDEEDLRCRIRAMSRQHWNATDQPGTGSPGRFVEDAGMLYAFIAAGRE